jgi:hypothetical protein
MAEATHRPTASLFALLAVAAVCILVAIVPTKASAAGNAGYCWGTWIHYHNEWCTNSAYTPNMTELVGSGEQHSVCVWAAAGQTQCSGGALQGVYNTSMAGCGTGCGVPAISNNGYDWNKVFGRVYWS